MKEISMQIVQDRRRFLATLSLAGAAGLVGAPRTLRAEPPPETTTVRLAQFLPAGCDTPVYVAGELLRAEGFTDVRYVAGTGDPSEWLARGESDFDWNFPPLHIALIEAGASVTVLAGMHSGCLELIANDSVRSITDLRGKKVGVYALTSSPHILLTLMTAYVGLDPVNDIQWVTSDDATSMDLFVDGKIDAFLAFPPEPQELRARKIGHTILNSTVDRPWSQYFCCLLTASAHYVTTYPVATKRVLRAHLKAIDLCVSDPKMVAQRLADDGFARQYDRALETLTEVRYDRWREFDPEDTLRFYALRMHEAGMIKSAPQKIIADGTDWRFLDELKREMKT
jgi:NitT/TauT family transport system substrate-binding protein